MKASHAAMAVVTGGAAFRSWDATAGVAASRGFAATWPAAWQEAWRVTGRAPSAATRCAGQTVVEDAIAKGGST